MSTLPEEENDGWDWSPSVAAERAGAMLEAAPDMVRMLQRYASECAECHGAGEIIRNDHNGDPEYDHGEPCGACEDIHALIDRAIPDHLYRRPAPPPPKVIEEVEDDIAF